MIGEEGKEQGRQDRTGRAGSKNKKGWGRRLVVECS